MQNVVELESTWTNVIYTYMYMLLDKLIEENEFRITETEAHNVCVSFSVCVHCMLYTFAGWINRLMEIISAKMLSWIVRYRKWFGIVTAMRNGILEIYSQIQIPIEHTVCTKMYARTKFHIQLNNNNDNIFVRLTTHTFLTVKLTKSSSIFFLFCFLFDCIFVSTILLLHKNKQQNRSYCFTLHLVAIEWQKKGPELIVENKPRRKN